MPRLSSLFRYRLRTLLAITTLAAIGLAGFKAFVEPFRMQRRAAEKLAALGAFIEFRPADFGWFQSLIDEQHIQHVVTVKLEHSRFKPHELAPLADLPHLERLYLAATPLTDDGLRYIASLRRLKRISLWNTRISDRGVRHLSGLSSLEVLDIHHTRLTEAALQHFRGHPNLRRLMHSIPVGDDGVQALASMPRLQVEWLRCLEIGDDALRQVARLAPLTKLYIDSRRVTDAGLAHLTRLKRLESLELRRCAATDSGIQQLAASPAMVSLSIDMVPIRGECLPALVEHPALRKLELKTTQIDFGQVARHVGPSATTLHIAPDGLHRNSKLRYVSVLRSDARSVILSSPIKPDDVDSLRYYTNIRSLVLARPPFDFARAGCLDRFEHLQSVELNLTLDDKGAEVLGRLRQLRQLTLSGRQAISPAGFQHLAGLSELSQLTMRSCGLSDEHLAAVGQLRGLEVLVLSGNHITAAGIEHLRDLSKLRKLEVSFCRGIDDQAFEKISRLERLEDLSAQETRVTDAGLTYLYDMPYLRSVTVLGSPATQRGLRALRGALLTKGGTIY